MSDPQPGPRAPRPIVVFDGDCGLCNGFVAWLIRRDPDARFLIAGSAGEVGRAALTAMGLPHDVAQSTLVIALPEGPALKSDASLTVAAGLTRPWRALARVGFAVPRGVRDRAYDAIAARRPRRPAEDAACGTPPASLVTTWRERLATVADVTALEERPPRRP
ncbi:thiol-disulfide oxidoreductase DCC family protein [Demequina sp. NBRC 110055]|uniref:thiol-disulfide oxidoreductase DCC family protein n=1 Tax=Demequina sp. NBRC 110055 TaxID=1570344 RepID=UPI001356406B|nr:DCC1-like thiol-disulfide oxidoreductase family protein [Demequina sp. NBRC 110055]